ncbi:MAG: acetamidase/formamidase family protein [Thermoplasmatota archaeon]|nr:acetamidase/formamidase family protein [Candidatus Thermoplasmatota archaeon]MBU1915212.1 acetamidase/formamidase family protein [Candidatus Thermoplasmatota archaeon]
MPAGDMLQRFSSKKVIHVFSPKNRPAHSVENGEMVVVESPDCFSGLVKTSKKLFEDVPMERVNPATGPVRVDGMSAGETLCISIEKIKCGPLGIIMCSPELGILCEDVRKSRTKIVEIRGNKAKFSDDLSIDLNPHVGVLGVSPAKGEFPTFHPGDHGGNMDTVEAREGSKVYLPTFVDGAMFALGDVHAAMGDGEVCGTGIEVPAEVTLSLSKADDIEVRRPMIETPTEWLSYAAAKTLDKAAKLATSDLVRFMESVLRRPPIHWGRKQVARPSATSDP